MIPLQFNRDDLARALNSLNKVRGHPFGKRDATYANCRPSSYVTVSARKGDRAAVISFVPYVDDLRRVKGKAGEVTVVLLAPATAAVKVVLHAWRFRSLVKLFSRGAHVELGAEKRGRDTVARIDCERGRFRFVDARNHALECLPEPRP